MAQNMADHSETASLPDWIRVLPLGRVELMDNREPFEVDPQSLNAMVSAFRSRGVDLVIDYEHQSLQGERAPAAGWIKDLEVRTDGLWARVEWTPQAQEYLRSKEYRYFSPVLRLDPESRKPLALMHLGLTNVPAIKHLPPLVAKWGGEGLSEKGAAQALAPVQDRQSEERMEINTRHRLQGLLGLDSQAGEEAVCNKAWEVFRNLAAALGLPEDAAADRLQGAVEALKAGGGLVTLQEELTALKSRVFEETAARTVEEALKAGKVIPAQQEWALEYCRRDPEGFQTYVARAPKLVPTGEELQLVGDGRTGEGELLPEELALCRALKLAPEEYLRAKARNA